MQGRGRQADRRRRGGAGAELGLGPGVGEGPGGADLRDVGFRGRPATVRHAGAPRVARGSRGAEDHRGAEEGAGRNRGAAGPEDAEGACAEIKDRAKFREARDAIFEEAAAAERAILTPAQRERLDQIQLQAQGPLAFSLGGDEPGSSSADRSRFVGPPVPQRLRMSADQVKRARTIAQEADTQISKAASVRIPWDSKDRPSAEDIRKLVAGAEFRAAKQKALRDARAAWDAAIARIEGVLADEQRAAYRKMLGRPFDLAKLNVEPGQSETDADVQAVSRGFGGGGQRADTGFNVSVARPAFTGWHPRVAIDEAHNNFHTAEGRYKPFADLMSNDGCVRLAQHRAARRPGARPLRRPGHRQRVGARRGRGRDEPELGVHGRGMLGRAAVGLGGRVAAPDHRPRAVRLGVRGARAAFRRRDEQLRHDRPGQ